MPCSDQTEVFELLLDEEDRVADVRLFKRTCGQAVGGAQLLQYMRGVSAEDALAFGLETWVPSLDALRLHEEFMLFKQFFSLRAALGVWAGLRSGAVAQPFALEELSYDEDGRCLIVGQIEVALIHEEIRACGGCRSCSTKSAPSQSVEPAGLRLGSSH
ncbi:MAG: hypothetical protein H6727_17420 [Myxococcales bacterium]|nr:hypothetical protein [Myxococcales bacterium]